MPFVSPADPIQTSLLPCRCAALLCKGTAEAVRRGPEAGSLLRCAAQLRPVSKPCNILRHSAPGLVQLSRESAVAARERLQELLRDERAGKEDPHQVRLWQGVQKATIRKVVIFMSCSK